MKNNQDSSKAAKNPSTEPGKVVADEASDLVTGQPEDGGGCSYQGYEFGAGSYPDSLCVDGRLYDADDCDDNHNLYEPVENIPCPVCRSADAIDYWTERNQRGGQPRVRARAAAKSLVAVILKNRGLLASEQKG